MSLTFSLGSTITLESPCVKVISLDTADTTGASLTGVTEIVETEGEESFEPSLTLQVNVRLAVLGLPSLIF